MNKFKINGISVSNPVDFEEKYLDFSSDYAIKKGFNHYQFIGPIHIPIHANIDGMVYYKKYSRFNDEKDKEYVDYSLKVVNKTCEKLHKNGIRCYMWHHELEVPSKFTEAYPEILNVDGDVEVTHELIKDFLENKINDFFDEYPLMDGIILTLHETKIPLLKLKNQKLDKIERVKYVTKILYDGCISRGKELIVRPFASIEEDYEMMTKAYETISKDLVIMDKWNQFDWSLTLPENAFFNKIKNNPLLVEGDVIGEYFGKGFLPIMLKDYITSKVNYSKKFNPSGFVVRIDRGGYDAFGTANEVNYEILCASLNEENVDLAIDQFFNQRYGEYGPLVKEIMEGTEDIQRKILYLNGYYYTELSGFPRLNHIKNHFYFEIMKKNCEIASNEWFIPKNWNRGEISYLFEEKNSAILDAKKKLGQVKLLKGKILDDFYDDLEFKFTNLYYTAKIWHKLTEILYSYVNIINNEDFNLLNQMDELLDELSKIYHDGKAILQAKFYPDAMSMASGELTFNGSVIENFITDIKGSIYLEMQARERLKNECLTDFIVCGGALESHKLMKEVNFSDTFIKEDGLCRIPGTNWGNLFSTVNAHGWFSYELEIKPNTKNTIIIVSKGTNDRVEYQATIDDLKVIVKEISSNKVVTEISYEEVCGKDKVRIRIDRISGYTPFIYEIKSK